MLQLNELKIDNNNLDSLPDLYHLPLKILLLTGNPWACDMTLSWVRMWPWAKLLPVLGNPVCAKPAELYGMQLMSVKPTQMHCYNGKVEGNQLKTHKKLGIHIYETSRRWIVISGNVHGNEKHNFSQNIILHCFILFVLAIIWWYESNIEYITGKCSHNVCFVLLWLDQPWWVRVEFADICVGSFPGSWSNTWLPSDCDRTL